MISAYLKLFQGRELFQNTHLKRFYALAAPNVKEKLQIFDTTLRDGEQSPGVTLDVGKKLLIAKQLSLLGVDICEVGFPNCSLAEYEAVSSIAKEIGQVVENRPQGTPMRIAGLARANEEDIEICYNAVKYAPLHRINTFMPTSDIQLEHKLSLSRKECIKWSYNAVRFARMLLDENGDIEFSAEDAGRSNPEFLVDIISAVIEAGATTINIADTVGYMLPTEYGGLFRFLQGSKPLKNNNGIVLSAHCHDDLGLATANTLAAIQNGARQVEVTCNGIGERAGNTCIEEVVMAIKTRPNYFPVRTMINAKHFYTTSKMVSSLTGMTVQPNKAIIGKNAFAHESGIHQDGLIKYPLNYQIIEPESVGVNEMSLPLGKHSGRQGLKHKLLQLGYDNISDIVKDKIYIEVNEITNNGTEITDTDIHSLVKKNCNM